MDEITRNRASNAILNTMFTGDYFAPVVYVVRNEIYFFENPAIRAQLTHEFFDGIRPRIEKLTIGDAYKYSYGVSMPQSMSKSVNWNMNQRGLHTVYETNGKTINEVLKSMVEEELKKKKESKKKVLTLEDFA